MKKKSSIIDVPRKFNQEDLFGIEKYQMGLQRFILNADTPLTVALQGEWGSGKTSLMNQLKNSLCDTSDSTFYGIWLNTWQYSLMKSKDDALISIIGGLTNDILSIIKAKHETKTQAVVSKAWSFVSKLGKAGAKAAVSSVGIDGEVVEGLFEKEGQEENLIAFKKALQEAIDECLKQDEKIGNRNRGFIFFIDDLDRIDPPVAVEILELIKNIFDLENCIFILAIDYDVVIKGLKPKFGELTDSNEREFRSFFDKIIQLPFSMPVANYQIENFLNTALKAIDFIPETEDVSSEMTRKLAEFASLSIGTNPRSLKRLTNTLSLINLINNTNELDEANDKNVTDSSERLINFALVCIQIAYPFIYNNLISDSDFVSWDETKANKMKLKPLTLEQNEILNATKEFDEPWEKVLFQMAQKDTYTSNRVFQISQLLNRIKELIPQEESLGDYISQILELSSVTNLVPNDGQKVITGARSVLQGGIKQHLLSHLPNKLNAPLINEIRILQKGENSRMEIRTGADKKQLGVWWAHPIFILIKQENAKMTIEFTTSFQRWNKKLIEEEFTYELKSKIEQTKSNYDKYIKTVFNVNILSVVDIKKQKDKVFIKFIAPIQLNSNALNEQILQNITDFTALIAQSNYELSKLFGDIN